MQASFPYSLMRHVLTLSLVLLMLGLAACSKAPSDASLSDAIRAGLYSDPVLKDDRIEVAVSSAEVTLTGSVSSDAARLQAYKLARETPGVRAVTDAMQLRSAQTQPVPEVQPKPPEPPSGLKEQAQSQSRPPAGASPIAAEATKPSETASVKPPQTQSGTAAPTVVTIPAGTTIRIQMIDSVDSKTSKAGDKFEASLDTPVVVGKEVVVPEDAHIYVALISAKSAGKLSGQSELKLELDHMEFEGKSYPLSSSVVRETGESRGKDTGKKAAIGAAVGVAIGAAAGGKKGAAIGAGAGAGAGVAAQVFLEGKQVQVPSETKLDFRLERPVEVTRSTQKK